MHDYCSYRLPSAFNNFFKGINKVQQYATRLASKKSYLLFFYYFGIIIIPLLCHFNT